MLEGGPYFKRKKGQKKLRCCEFPRCDPRFHKGPREREKKKRKNRRGCAHYDVRHRPCTYRGKTGQGPDGGSPELGLNELINGLEVGEN